MRNRYNVRTILWIGFIWVSTSTYATETLSGIVSDTANPAQPINGAVVTLLDAGGDSTGLSSTTDAQGAFSINFDPATVETGTPYALAVQASGFRPRELNVDAGQSNPISLSAEHSHTYFEPVQLDDGIPTGELADVLLEPTSIENLLNKTVQAYPTGYQELHSLLIFKDGLLVVEEYYQGNNDYIDFEGGIVRETGSPSQIQWGRTNRHYVASVNKALTATVAGIALENYDETPQTTIASLLPTYSTYFSDTNKEALTLHDLMTMQLGFVWDEWGSNDLTLLWQSDDFTEFLLERNNNGPQSSWVYNSASPNMLLRGLDYLVSGSIRDYADTHFYSKLGITDYDWQSQPDGYPEGGARMYMRPRDMLKVGITYLQDGAWNGEQVIPTNWVNEVSQVQVAGSAGDYSYYFWHRTLDGVDYLSADGDGGQYINIFPEENMVIVMTQGNYLGWPLYVNQADNMMSYILPAVIEPTLSVNFNNQNVGIASGGTTSSFEAVPAGSLMQLLWSATGSELTLSNAYNNQIGAGKALPGEYILDEQTTHNEFGFYGPSQNIYTSDDVGGANINDGFFYLRAFDTAQGAVGGYVRDFDALDASEWLYNPDDTTTIFINNLTGGTPGYFVDIQDGGYVIQNFDIDGDGLSNSDETTIHFTDPNDADSDNDGLSDGDEVNVYSTNPNNSDSDGDGFYDGDEVSGLDPNTSNLTIFNNVLSKIADMRLGSQMVSVSNSQALLRFGLDMSDDLTATWQTNAYEIEVEIPATNDVQFFRLRMD